MVMTEEPMPGAGMVMGLKLTEIPDGWADTLSEMAALNTLDTLAVMVTVVDDPGATVTDPGLGISAKSGTATVSDTWAVAVTPPPVPVSVTVYIPVGVEDEV